MLLFRIFNFVFFHEVTLFLLILESSNGFLWMELPQRNTCEFVPFSPGFCGRSGEGFDSSGENCERSRVEIFVRRGKVGGDLFSAENDHSLHDYLTHHLSRLLPYAKID